MRSAVLGATFRDAKSAVLDVLGIEAPFSRVGLPRADNSAIGPSLRVDDDMKTPRDVPDRNIALFPVVRPPIRYDESMQEIEALNLGEVDAVLGEIRDPLAFVPFKEHGVGVATNKDRCNEL
jgi:hypothetical protein